VGERVTRKQYDQMDNLPFLLAMCISLSQGVLFLQLEENMYKPLVLLILTHSLPFSLPIFMLEMTLRGETDSHDKLGDNYDVDDVIFVLDGMDMIEVEKSTETASVITSETNKKFVRHVLTVKIQ
jgi:hypothetical protein